MDFLIKERKTLQELRKKYTSKKIVATNGCFDILHLGHVRYLKAAKELGDILVVALNSDYSVRALKSSPESTVQRPINNELARAEVLNSLYCVDYTYIFSQRTADSFLRDLKPDLYAKAGDYSLDSLPERKTLEELGAKVYFLDFHSGYSTSELIKKLDPPKV